MSVIVVFSMDKSYLFVLHFSVSEIHMTYITLSYQKVTVLPPEINVILNQYNTLLFSVLSSPLRNHLDSMIYIHILASYP